MDEIVNELNYDFNYHVHLFSSCVNNLNIRDKNLAILWINKLKTVAGSIEEARLRNDFIYFLVKSCNVGILKEPFNRPPPSGPLLNLLSLLPAGASKTKSKKSTKSNAKKAEIFERSPDKGAFLAAQPVPRCGVFCYLAVITKSPEQ